MTALRTIPRLLKTQHREVTMKPPIGIRTKTLPLTKLNLIMILSMVANRLVERTGKKKEDTNQTRMAKKREKEKARARAREEEKTRKAKMSTKVKTMMKIKDIVSTKARGKKEVILNALEREVKEVN